MGTDVICQFYNYGKCYDQQQKECKRPDGIRKHLCAFVKASSGNVCGASHMKGEHDVQKHGN